MGAGKIIAIVGAIIGVISVVLSLIVPQFFGWYRLEISGFGMTVGIYFTGLGTLASIPPGGPTGMDTMILIGGIMLLAGAVLCIIGAFKEMKALGIVGGILILLGPMLLLLELLIGMGEFATLISLLGGPVGANVIWGSSVLGPGVVISWGIWIGFFLSLGAGVLGIIGGASL